MKISVGEIACWIVGLAFLCLGLFSAEREGFHEGFMQCSIETAAASSYTHDGRLYVSLDLTPQQTRELAETLAESLGMTLCTVDPPQPEQEPREPQNASQAILTAYRGSR